MALTARKIAVTVNSRQHQGISVPKDKKIRTVFVAQYGSDVFCSGNTKNPSRKTWIFSFAPQAQPHLHGTRNIISSEARTSLLPRGTN